MSTSIDFSALREAAQRLVDDGLPACQVAVARDRELVMFETFGDATDTTRFRVASSTKPIVGSAILQLIGDGQLDIDARVVDYIPEFGTHGKDVVTIEQLMVFSCGFPRATMPSRVGADRAQRVARFARVGARLGARHRVRIPPGFRALGDGRAHRPPERHRLPRLHRAARHAAARPPAPPGLRPRRAGRHRRAHRCRRHAARSRSTPGRSPRPIASR